MKIMKHFQDCEAGRQRKIYTAIILQQTLLQTVSLCLGNMVLYRRNVLNWTYN